MLRALALHQFDTNAVGRRDITQLSPPDAFLQRHGKAHPFGAQLVAEGAQVAAIDEAEVIGAPFIVAGVIGVRLNRLGGRRRLAGTLAANDKGLATNLDENLRAPRATVSATMSAPNICTYQLAESFGLWLMMWM